MYFWTGLGSWFLVLIYQMWLCDKMKLVADPANDWVYQARDWRSNFVEIRSNVEDWLDFFMAVEEEHICEHPAKIV